jgi:hypothetical protein
VRVAFADARITVEEEIAEGSRSWRRFMVGAVKSLWELGRPLRGTSTAAPT